MHGTLQDHCRMYLGVKPYDTDTNVVKHDPYFLISMETLWGKEAVKKVLNEVISEIFKDSIKELI